MAQEFYYSTMRDEKLKVMLQGVFPTGSENYDPNKFVRSPIQAGIWWSYLNYNTHLYEGNHFMVCFFIKAFPPRHDSGSAGSQLHGRNSLILLSSLRRRTFPRRRMS